VWHAADTVQDWGNRGINGFILSYVGEWYATKDDLDPWLTHVTNLNRMGAAYGVDSNFILVPLAWQSWRDNSVLPSWTDDAAWAPVLENFTLMAQFIRDSGSKGITLDTETYNGNGLWNVSNPRFGGASRATLKTAVYKRGQQIMQRLVAAAPGIEVMLLQEGHYHWFVSRLPDYELWIDFYNGLASVKSNGGIVIGAENSYGITDSTALEKLYSALNSSMQTHAADRAYWNAKGSNALGLYPLGVDYANKASLYSARQFSQQFKEAIRLCPKYVWIYSHGAAWWQLTQAQVEKYSQGYYIFNPQDQMLPTDPKVTEYYAVLSQRNSRASGMLNPAPALSSAQP
jgi:hypothetical protein